jgi:hypothetical protein
MSSARRRLPRRFVSVALIVIVVLLVIVWLGLAQNCPSEGIALTSRARHLHRLKNRTAFPKFADFDLNVTLDKLLVPGDDTNRWSIERAGRVEGEVIDVAYAVTEATNCYNPCRRDIHINLATHKGAAKTEYVVLEVTPNLRDWASAHGIDWSEPTLQSQLVGHWVQFEGWLYFDLGHAEESENTAPGNPENWRGTAWELHPVTKITVIR